MQKLEIVFTIQLEKKFHEIVNQTRESFCNQYIINEIEKSKENIEKYLTNEKDKEKYIPYIKMLKDNKENLKDTVTYELIETNKNIETVKVKFIFNYYENTIFSLKRTLEEEVFIGPMEHNYFMAEIIEKEFSKYPEADRLGKSIVELYKYVGDLFYQAHLSATVNGKPLLSETVIEQNIN